MQIRIRATFEEISFPSDEPDTDPDEVRGYTDPRNPWGGFDCIPDDDNAPPHPRTTEEWDAYLVSEGVDILTFDTLKEAAEFALDFPGGIWNHSESESEQNVRTGGWRSVTLHIQDHEECVFEMMDAVEELRKVDA